MVTPQDVLIRAHDLLGEYGICRGSYAIDGNGNATFALDKNAVAFCSVGAICRALVDLTGKTADGNIDLYLQTRFCLSADKPMPMGISGWNDALATDQEILSTFRKAAGLPEPSVSVEELAEASEQVLVAV